MSRSVLIVIVVGVVLVVAGGVWLGLGYTVSRDVGPSASEQRDVGRFTQVEVSGEGTLYLRQGSATELRIEGPRRLVELVRTEVSGDVLRVDQRWGFFGFEALWGDGEIAYYLTVPDLQAVRVSGAVTVEGQSRFETERLEIKGSGSTRMSLDLRVDALDIGTSGSAEVTLAGEADTLAIDGRGSTEVSAADLVCRAVTIDCSGSSQIEVYAREELSVHASGSSDIRYLGDPLLETDVSGSGDVRRSAP